MIVKHSFVCEVVGRDLRRPIPNASPPVDPQHRRMHELRIHCRIPQKAKRDCAKKLGRLVQDYEKRPSDTCPTSMVCSYKRLQFVIVMKFPCP